MNFKFEIMLKKIMCNKKVFKKIQILKKLSYRNFVSANGNPIFLYNYNMAGIVYRK